MNKLMMTKIALALCATMVACAAASDVPFNCTTIAEQSENLYNVTDCLTDPGIEPCISAFNSCVNATSDCNAAFTCMTTQLRCLELARPNTTACEAAYGVVLNEIMYLTGGGDYNGSKMELSCQHLVCHVLEMPAFTECPGESYANVCVDAIATQVPVTAEPAGPSPTTPGTTEDPETTPSPDGAATVGTVAAAALLVLFSVVA